MASITSRGDFTKNVAASAVPVGSENLQRVCGQNWSEEIFCSHQRHHVEKDADGQSTLLRGRCRSPLPHVLGFRRGGRPRGMGKDRTLRQRRVGFQGSELHARAAGFQRRQETVVARRYSVQYISAGFTAAGEVLLVQIERVFPVGPEQRRHYHLHAQSLFSNVGQYQVWIQAHAQGQLDQGTLGKDVGAAPLRRRTPGLGTTGIGQH